MKTLSAFHGLLFATVICTAPAHAQQLTVQTEEGKQVVLSREDLRALPQVEAQVRMADAPVKFEVASLYTILDKAGVGLGESLRGKRMATVVVVGAADGYRAAIALAEIDPGFTDKQVLLAYSKDGKPLDAKEAPYRLIIPDEKRMARWVRQVTGLKVVAVQ